MPKYSEEEIHKKLHELKNWYQVIEGMEIRLSKVEVKLEGNHKEGISSKVERLTRAADKKDYMWVATELAVIGLILNAIFKLV